MIIDIVHMFLDIYNKLSKHVILVTNVTGILENIVVISNGCVLCSK